MFGAPAAGYADTFSVSRVWGASNYETSGGLLAYVRLRDSLVFGKFAVELINDMVDSNGIPFRIEFAYNPYGSRNLEEDPSTSHMINIPRRQR